MEHSNLRNHRVEVLLNNFLDKDMQSMLLPLNLMQIFQFCPKYCIRDNFITPNSHFSQLLSVFGTLLYISVLVYEIYNMYNKPNKFLSTTTPFISTNVNFVSNCLGFLLNLVLTISKTNENVLLILKIQEIYRFLNNKSSFKLFIISNWLAVMVFLVWHICSTFFFCVMLDIPVHVILSSVILFSLDSHIVYAVRLIQFLKYQADLWNMRALQYERINHRDRQYYCEKLFLTYGNILDCYDIYKILYQQMVSKIKSLVFRIFFLI